MQALLFKAIGSLEFIEVVNEVTYQSLRCFMVYIHTLICSTVFMLGTLMQQFFSSCHGEGSVVQLSTAHKNRYSSQSIGQNLIKHAQSDYLMSK